MSKVFSVRYFTRTKNFQNHRLYSYYHILAYDPKGRYRLVERSALRSCCPYRRVVKRIGLCIKNIDHSVHSHPVFSSSDILKVLSKTKN